MIINYRAATDFYGHSDGFIESCFYSCVIVGEQEVDHAGEYRFHNHFEYTNGEWRYDPDD